MERFPGNPAKTKKKKKANVKKKKKVEIRKTILEEHIMKLLGVVN